MIATMLVPTGALASSIRPGSRVTHGSLNSKAKAPKCLVEEKWQPCEVVIDETGVKASEGHITNRAKMFIIYYIYFCQLRIDSSFKIL